MVFIKDLTGSSVYEILLKTKSKTLTPADLRWKVKLNSASTYHQTLTYAGWNNIDNESTVGMSKSAHSVEI
jgi:hypothetical protein